MLMLNLSFPWFSQNTLLAVAFFLGEFAARVQLKLCLRAVQNIGGYAHGALKSIFFYFPLNFFDSCDGSGEKEGLLVV